MFLEKLDLLNFKNYAQASAQFSPHINSFTGLNGSGKTNILDAIHYISLTKSAFNSLDAQNIQHDRPYFSIKGNVHVNDNVHEVQCSLKRGEKKAFKVDGADYDRLSHHLGRFPSVLIAPNDDDLIRDSNEVRRKYFDSIISQTSKDYVQKLIQYNHYLKQRNSLLKSFGDSGKVDKELLAPYDHKILGEGKYLASKRAEFIKVFVADFENHYDYVSDEKEKVHIEYASRALSDDFEQEYHRSLPKDLALQRSNVGIHRDEYIFTIEGNALKKFGSQGQQKSFLISLKLAQFDYIKRNTGITPFLLLDDIFDKLDDNRIKMLTQMIASN